MPQIFKVVSFFIFSYLPFLAIGQAESRKYSNEFLSIGIGARSLGMSNAITASVDDVTSGYWNPAGLLNIRSNIQVSAMHAQYFAGIANFDYGAVGAKIDDNSAIGFSLVRLAVDDIPNTLQAMDANGNLDYAKVTSFSTADYAFIFSYARKITKVEGLSVGGNLKIIYRKVGEFATAYGFGADVGAQYKKGKFLFSASGRDITSTFNAWNFTINDADKATLIKTGNDLPNNSIEITLPALIIGTAFKTDINRSFTFLAEVNLNNTFDRMRNTVIKSNVWSADPSLGVEVGFKNIVFLRGGVGNIQKEKETRELEKYIARPTIGIGIKFKSIAIDYALADVGDASVLKSNIFSLRIDINRKKS